MNTLRKYSLILTALGLMLLTGCEKDFDKINTNPNQTLDAATPALLAQAIRDLGYNDFTTFNLGRQSSVAAQHFAQRNYTSEDRYSFRSGTTDAFFRNNYIYMQNLQKIIDLNTDPATKDKYAALYGDNGMQIACAEILKCWVFQLLTDYFGDIPYTQALNIKEHPQPVYNTQKEVYDGMIAKLNAAQNALIASTTGGFTSGDLFYNGDLDQWIKLANSLRLRIALRASNADPAYLAEANDAIADGVFDSNADNAVCPFSTTGAPNEAPWYNGFYVSGRNDLSFTRRFMELIKGNNDGINDAAHPGYFTNPFPGLRDPRYTVFTSYTTNRNGVPYGMTDGVTQAWWSQNSGTRVSLYARNPLILQPNFPSTFLDYPTVCFMRCEVEGWDAAWFQEGIEASIEQWGAAPDPAYVASIVALFNAGTNEQKKEYCITQKYIHLLMQSHEAWFEYRRTGYPKSLLKPGDFIINFSGADRFFVPVPGSESGADVVARFKYPSSEYTLNKVNVEAAVARMGEDSHRQKVWWDGGGTQ